MNLLVKYENEQPRYIINCKTAIATRLSKAKFEKLQELNDFLKDYEFLSCNELDNLFIFEKVHQKLTQKHLYKEVYFYYDFIDHKIHEI